MRSTVRLLASLGIALTILAGLGCGGSDEPVETLVPIAATLPSPTFTPTPAATATLAATPTRAAASTPVATPSPVVAPTIPAPSPTPGVAANCPAADPASTPPGDVPPNIFLGTATINGQVVPDGTNVTSCIDGEPVASSLVTAGMFLITVEQRTPSLDGKEVAFSIDGVDANETAVWSIGGAVLIDLSAQR